MYITNNKILLTISLIVLINLGLSSQVLVNQGGLIHAYGGAYIHVNGTIANTSGDLNIDEQAGNPAELYVTGDIRNNSNFSGDGHIRLLGNWFDNNIFVGGTGTVFLEGANQILGGTSATVFNNLTLDGSGLKTQTIDKYANGILDLKHLELQTETNVFYVENTDAVAIIRTTGFVSSLNGGKLSRKTNSVSNYLYPVGSSLGVARYRPVEITPTDGANNTYTVRLANLDPTVEGYDVNVISEDVCEVNPLFYHQIDRSSGISSADINIYFDEIADGSWDAIANNETVIFQWEEVSGSSVVAGAPLSTAFKLAWGNFTDDPYALCKNITPITFNDLGPFCINGVAVALPLASIEGITGTWNPAAINTSSVGTIDYLFTPDVGQGCADTYTMSIEIEVCCNITLTASTTDAPCFGENGQIIFSSIGGQVPFAYTVNDINAVSPYGTLAGNYTVVVTDGFGCTSSVNVVVDQPQILQVSVVTSPATCGGDGGTAFASYAGGVASYGFLWSNTETSSNLVDLDPGTYSVVVTDGNGCTTTNYGVVGVLGGINANINILHPISCPNDSDGIIEATCSSSEVPINYIWGGSETTSTLSNVGSGSYVVNISDNWGCNGMASVTLVNPQSMQIGATIEPVKCFGENNGRLNLNVLGGSAPYSYIWSNLYDGPDNTLLPGGDYIVTVIDANSCTATNIFTIIEPEELVLISDVTDVSCFDYADGTISMTASGGVAPYYFTIIGNDQEYSASSFIGLVTGYYGLMVQDQNHCIDSIDIAISEPSQIAASYTVQEPSCIGNNDGYIEVYAIGGSAPYLYSWDEGFIDIPIISGLTQGSYNVSIVDANNCVYEIETVSLTDMNEDCIRIPNAFSPNSDGINDTWIVENLELFANARVNVFNRWGQLLYTGIPGDEWDGRFNDKLVPTTSYVYVIELYNGSDAYVGIVTVIY